jgi:hypothetical protein
MGDDPVYREIIFHPLDDFPECDSLESGEICLTQAMGVAKESGYTGSVYTY